jgi:phosphatidylglycerol:prolipoprotein diacylglycerol transferase
MLPIIKIFGNDFPTYSLMVLLALFFGFSFLFIRKSNYVKKEDVIYSTLFALLFFGFGGKLLYIIITLIQINNFSLDITPELIMDLLKGGYVWYGAFFGALLGFFIYCKKYRIDFPALMEDTILVIPLVHFFGRLGCLFAGCCYGIPFPTPVGVYFKENSFAPHDISLLPIQLIEAVFNLILFFVMLKLSKKEGKKYTLYSIYAFAYGIFRFFAEFLRYDQHRGFILFFSTSQWISIILIITGFCSLKKGLLEKRNLGS